MNDPVIIKTIAHLFLSVDNYDKEADDTPYIHDKKDTLFEGILNFEYNPNKFPEISFKVFEEYFFNLPQSFNDNFEKLSLAIKSKDYIFIHSYGKNGKTTFINFVQNKVLSNHLNLEDLSEEKKVLYRYSLEQPIYDFRDDQKNHMSDKLKLLVEQFYQRSFHRFNQAKLEFHNKTCLHPLFLLSNSVSNEYKVILNENKNIHLNQESKAFLEVTRMLTQLEGTDYENPENSALDIIEKIKAIYTKTYRISENKEIKWNIEFYYFCLNILLVTNIHISTLIGSTSPLVFIFDNLDDVYTFIPEEVALTYSTRMINSLQNLTSSFPSTFKVTKSINGREIQFAQKAKFVFIYRTSNFLSTMSMRLNQSDSNNSRTSQHEEYIQLSTVKSSADILETRLNLYERVCNSLDITEERMSPKAKILKSILGVLKEKIENENELLNENKIEMKSIDNLVMLFRLWNGNKMEFIRVLIDIDFSKECKLILSSKHANKRVKIELYFSYIMNHFYRKTLKNNALERSINTAFNDFSNSLDDPRPSLSRLFFSYVFHYRSKAKTDENYNNSYARGVQLRHFINNIKDLENKGKKLYSGEEIEDFLFNTFSFPVDHWGNFYNCCGETKTNLNSSGEHYKWLDDLHNVIYDRQTPKNVTVFYRDAAFYFILYLRRSFEYFAFADYLRRGRSNKYEYMPICEHAIHYIFEASGKLGNFNSFHSRLTRIRDRIKILCKYTVQFFIDLTPKLSLDQFSKSHWNIEQQLYHKDLISKIIDFLNSFEKWLENEDFFTSNWEHLMKEKSLDQIKYKTIEIRIAVLKEVVNYCKLNSDLYEICEKYCKEEVISEIPKNLKNANKSLSQLSKNTKDKINQLETIITNK